MECPNCHQQVPDTANVCGHCGHRLKVAATAMIVCPNCKAQNRPDVRFCEECGASLSSPAVPVQNTPLPVPQEQPDQMAESPAGQKIPVWGPVQWIVGAVVWILLFLLLNFLERLLSFYVLNPEMRTLWNGFLEFYRYSGVNPMASIIWAVPGALAGVSLRSTLRMFLGFIICIPLVALLNWVSYGFVHYFSNGLFMSPFLGAILVVWSGAHGVVKPGFPLILRWILLVVCGAFLSLMLYSVIHDAVDLGVIEIVLSLAWIALAIIAGIKGKRTRE